MYLDEKKFGETPVPAPDALGSALLTAAAYMEQKGHAKWQLRDHSGAVCFNGALFHGAGLATSDLWLAAAQRCGFESTMAAVTWNNVPERTGAEVIARLRTGAQS